METIDYLHSVAALTFFLAAIDKLRRTQQEHFYTRIIAAIWFTATVVYHDMPVLVVRVISNCVIIAIPMTELASPKFINWWRKK